MTTETQEPEPWEHVLADLLDLDPRAHGRLMTAARAVMACEPIPCPICRETFATTKEWGAHGPCVEPLWATVADLREELRDLKAELAEEVRTQRLVVVDNEGRERITADVDGEGTAELLVESNGASAYLWAHMSGDVMGNPAGSGLSIFVGGNSVAALSATDDQMAALEFRHDDHPRLATYVRSDSEEK